MKKTIYIISLIVFSFHAIGQTLSLSSINVKPGAAIQVSFTAPSAYAENAWIGIIPSEVPHGNEAVNDKNDISYQYLKKRTSGTLEFKAPAKAGNYDFRLNDNDNSGKEVASVSFTVGDIVNGEIAGTYKTDFEEMVLFQTGNKVTGTYKYKNGRIEGTLNGKVLTGTWTQSNAKGRLEFIFNDDFSSFQGKWNYNESAPSSKWNGTKIGSSASIGRSAQKTSIPENTKINGTYKTDFEEMTLRINGNKVSGTYKYKDGKIAGTLNGQTLVGTWTQSNAKGRFEFVFSSDFSSFQGKWNYNESAPSSKWNGTKTK